MSLSLLAAAREAPESVALVETGRAWTFAELAPAVAAEAAALARSAGGGRPFLLLDANVSLETLVRLFAAFEAGIPTALLHPRWTGAERSRAAAAVPGATESDAVARDGRVLPWNAPPPPDDDRPLAVVFTSGSTAAPKGVVLSRAAMAASAAASAERLGWRDDDRWVLSLSPAHVGGLSIVTRCLLARRTIVLQPAEGAAALLDAIRAERVTLLSLVAAQLRRLLDAAGGDAPASLRAVLVGGGPCPLALLDEAWRRGWPVLPTYGMTEACSQVATAAPGWTPEDGLAVPPLPGVEVRVVEGEIQVRGPIVSASLLPEDAHPSPLTTDGWLRTGDLGRLDGRGRIEVLGRRDTVIVTGGENVGPEEVETALLECPDVREALVFGVEDPTWGALVAAAVVPAPGTALDAAALRAGLTERLASFKLPRLLAVVDELPRLAGGKPDRRGASAALAHALRRFR
ncbi:MAG: AMP-binding protein [Acidobacteriota bacterium]